MPDSVTRSGSYYSTPRDANRVPFLLSASSADGITPVVLESDPTTHSLFVGSYAYTGFSYTPLRTPTTFKTTTATQSGNTAIWTPTTGKKFRLMGYAVYAPDDIQAGSAGDIDVTFQDGTTPLGLGFTFWAPDNTSTSNRHNDNSGVVQLGNGYLSTAINNALNVNLSTAITSGKIRITVWGTEE